MVKGLSQQSSIQKLRVFIDPEGELTILGKCAPMILGPPVSQVERAIEAHEFKENEDFAEDHDDPEEDGIACAICGRLYFPAMIEDEDDYESLGNFGGSLVLSVSEIRLILESLRARDAIFLARRLEEQMSSSYLAFHYHLIPDMKEVMERAIK